MPMETAGSLKFVFHMGMSRAMIQMTVDDARMATRLLLKYCWASMMTAMSMKSRIIPLTADFRIRPPRKMPSARIRLKVSSSIPAALKRRPPSRKGGNPLRATPMK